MALDSIRSNIKYNVENKMLKGSKEWNEEMIDKYNPAEYHANASFVVRFIEGSRRKKIIQEVHKKNPKSVLEIGSGAGDIIGEVQAPERTGMDYSVRLLNIARDRFGDGIRWLEGDAQGLPEEIAAQKYDVVFSSEVIEHINYPEKMLEEIDKITHQDSSIIISTPNEDLINKLKVILLKLKIFDLIVPGISKKMDDEWHIHAFDIPLFKKFNNGRFNIEKIYARPFSWLPIRYIFVCSKKVD